MDTKYCETVFFGKYIGFPNQQIRASAFSLSHLTSKASDAAGVVEILRSAGIVCTDPMVEPLQNHCVVNAGFR